MFIRQIAVLGLLVATAACGLPETVRLTDNPGASLVGKELHSTREAPPSFIAMTPVHSAFAVVGVLAAVAEGDTLVAEAGIENPAAAIEDGIARHLMSRYRASGNGQPLTFEDGKPGDLAAWARENNIRDLIIDVETNGWGFNVQGFDYGSYSVGYSALFRLIDSSSGEIVAQHFCSGTSHEDPEGAPSHDDLLANDAALIKSLLDERARACIEEITTQVL